MDHTAGHGIITTTIIIINHHERGWIIIYPGAILGRSQLCTYYRHILDTNLHKDDDVPRSRSPYRSDRIGSIGGWIGFVCC
jgi:hypothetical protein